VKHGTIKLITHCEECSNLLVKLPIGAHITEKWSFTDRESRLGQSGGVWCWCRTSNPFRPSFDKSYNSSLTLFQPEVHFYSKTWLEFAFVFHNFFLLFLLLLFYLDEVFHQKKPKSNDVIAFFYLSTKVKVAKQLKLTLFGGKTILFGFNSFFLFYFDSRWRKKV
jgi:hypothetical protein